MIYDPARRALELRQQIIDSMSPEELERYRQSLDDESTENAEEGQPKSESPWPDLPSAG